MSGSAGGSAGGGSGKSGSGGDGPEVDISVLVRFSTKQKQYAVPGSSVSVKASSNDADLNQVIKAFIQQASGEEKELPEFEFVIADQLLKSQLYQQMEKANLSFEQVVNVEYFEKQPPPTPKDSLHHDDWVAGLQCSEEWLLTGCYDNTVHLWDVAGLEAGMGDRAHKLTIPAHRASVKSVAWINTDGPLKSFVSTSIDQTAVVWVWDSTSNAVECVSECRGHTQSVECVSVDESKKQFATGAWDNTLKIWSVEDKKAQEEEVEEEESERKKRKSKKPNWKTPIVTLAGHTESISGVQWTDVGEVTTSSWDHSIRVWDVEIGGVKSQINGNVAFFSLSYSPFSRTILASSPDHYIRLYDPRQKEGNIVQEKYISHTKWVSCVRWCAARENLFVSGGYDSLVKMWDFRSPKTPLYNLKGHEDKVLAVDWSNSRYVASGSSDCTAKVFNAR